jgi:hypothetical protein
MSVRSAGPAVSHGNWRRAKGGEARGSARQETAQREEPGATEPGARSGHTPSTAFRTRVRTRIGVEPRRDCFTPGPAAKWPPAHQSLS